VKLLYSKRHFLTYLEQWNNEKQLFWKKRVKNTSVLDEPPVSLLCKVVMAIQSKRNGSRKLSVVHIPKRTMLLELENKAEIYRCDDDRVLTENEWRNDPVRRSGSEPLRVTNEWRLGGGVRDWSTEPPSGDSGRVEIERVCKERTSTLPTFVPDHFVHQNNRVFRERQITIDEIYCHKDSDNVWELRIWALHINW
jgi:hypothetical protein